MDCEARKVRTRRGEIGTSTPVFGFRPILCVLSRKTNVPKPEIFTFSPSASALLIWSSMDSTICADSARDRPIVRFSVSARSARVNVCRSEEHTSELQSLMRISYAVFCLKKNKQQSLIRISFHVNHLKTTATKDIQTKEQPQQN